MAGSGIVKVTKYIQSVDNLLNDRGQSVPVVFFDDSFVFSVLDNETYLSYDVENDEWYFDIGGLLPNILSGLIDVSFTNLTDQNFLVYDAINGLWKNDSSIIQNLQTQITTNSTDIVNNQISTNLDIQTINNHLTTHDTDILNLQLAVSSATVPIGGIMLWSGSVVPTGWLLCDGTHGTPNLLDRFVIGGTLAEVNQYGGSQTPTSGAISQGQITIYEGNLPPHTHRIAAFNVGGGGHEHNIGYNNSNKWTGGNGGSAREVGSGSSQSTGGGGGHTHTIPVHDTGNGNGGSIPIDVYVTATTTKYYVLAYIMFSP